VRTDTSSTDPSSAVLIEIDARDENSGLLRQRRRDRSDFRVMCAHRSGCDLLTGEPHPTELHRRRRWIVRDDLEHIHFSISIREP